MFDTFIVLVINYHAYVGILLILRNDACFLEASRIDFR